MSSNPLVAGSRSESALRRRLWLLSIPKRKRKPRPLRGGEVELLEMLGELPRRPSDLGASPREHLSRRVL